MKKLLVLAIMLTVFTVPAMANDIDEVWSKADKRIGVDMPYAVQIMSTPAYVGFSVDKGIGSDSTFSDDYRVLAKITFSNTLWGKSPWAQSVTE